MRTKNIRRTVAAFVAAIGILSAIPAFSAGTKGSITVTSPLSYSALSGVTEINWTFVPGTYVKSSTSRVEVLLTDYNAWSVLATGVRIRNGGIVWDTTTIPDGVYAVRAKVQTTSASIFSRRGQLIVDNLAPQVAITSPSAQTVLATVDDTNYTAPTIVAGKSTVTADAFDALSGIASVTWKLDGVPIGPETGINTSYTHDFNTVTPGEHILTVMATDRAGNASTEDSINIVTLPGPSAAGGPAPSPDPSTLPVPLPDPTTVPQPDPSTLPVPLPDPSELPIPPAPSPDPSTVPQPDPNTIPIPTPPPLPV